MTQATRCEARQDGQHLTTYLNGHRVCYWCRRALDDCCDGDNPDAPDLDAAFVENTEPGDYGYLDSLPKVSLEKLDDLPASQRPPSAARCGYIVSFGGRGQALRCECYLERHHPGDHQLDVFAPQLDLVSTPSPQLD